jgi:hypothetical protein
MACPYKDFFTPSSALGHSISPLAGLRKALQHEEDFVNELLTQDTRFGALSPVPQSFSGV